MSIMAPSGDPVCWKAGQNGPGSQGQGGLPSLPAKSRFPQEPTSPRAHERAERDVRRQGTQPHPPFFLVFFLVFFFVVFKESQAAEVVAGGQGGLCSATDDDASKRTTEKLSKSNQPRPPTFGGPEKKPSGLALRLVPLSRQSVPWATELGEGTKAVLCLSKSPDPATQTSSPGKGR
jgi:hypothetical protein